jgi:hypothetical protein
MIDSPAGGSLRLDDVTLSGVPNATLSGSFYRHRIPGEVWLLVGGILLGLCALAFDLWWDPRRTPTAALVTATATGAMLVFCSSAAGHPGLRQVFGSTIVGGIGGVPTAGIIAWLARRSRDTRDHIPAAYWLGATICANRPALPGNLETLPGPGTGDPGQRGWVLWLALLGAAVLVVLVSRADLDQLLHTARSITPSLLVLPALATLGSYLTMAWSYQGIARVAGYALPFGEMCRITLVANTANYLLSTGGLSGFALRMYLFARRGIPAGSAVLISLVQTLLTNLVLLVFVMWGFALLLLSHNLVGRDLIAAGALLIVFGLVVIATCLVLLRRTWRRGLLFRATRPLRPHPEGSPRIVGRAVRRSSAFSTT